MRTLSLLWIALFRIVVEILALIAGVYVLREALNVLRRYLVENTCTRLNRDVSLRLVSHVTKTELSSLNGEKMQNLRSALNRVTREKNIPVVTSTDEKYLYVWRADRPSEATE